MCEITFDAVSIPQNIDQLHELENCLGFQGKYKRTCKLGSCRTHESNEARGIDDASTSVKALGLIDGVCAHGEDGVLAAPPDAFDVDLHRKVPDLLLSVESVIIRGMHDPCIVELHPQKLSVRFFVKIMCEF